MQMQGELKARGARLVYRNSAHAFVKICRDEGLRGIQRGLTAGIAYQVLLPVTIQTSVSALTPAQILPTDGFPRNRNRHPLLALRCLLVWLCMHMHDTEEMPGPRRGGDEWDQAWALRTGQRATWCE